MPGHWYAKAWLCHLPPWVTLPYSIILFHPLIYFLLLKWHFTASQIHLNWGDTGIQFNPFFKVESISTRHTSCLFTGPYTNPKGPWLLMFSFWLPLGPIHQAARLSWNRNDTWRLMEDVTYIEEKGLDISLGDFQDRRGWKMILSTSPFLSTVLTKIIPTR